MAVSGAGIARCRYAATDSDQDGQPGPEVGVDVVGCSVGGSGFAFAAEAAGSIVVTNEKQPRWYLKPVIVHAIWYHRAQ